MPEITLYHDPRCSKSRQTLALLREREIKPKIVEYLQTPLDERTIKALLCKLGLKPIELIRQIEYRALELSDTDDETELIRRLAAHPEIIERPIVVSGTQARLGRPPQRVLEII